MSELDTVLDALRKADAAGNIEDARKLAAIADRLSKSQQPVEEAKDLGTMPFVNKAIAEAVGAPVDLMTAGINLIPGVDIQKPFGGSESIKGGMGAMGIELPPEGRQPESMPETTLLQNPFHLGIRVRIHTQFEKSHPHEATF